MKCFWEEAELVAHGARRLDAERAAAVERHLEACASCREFVARQRTVWATLDGWEAPPVPASFDERLYRRMAEDRAPWWKAAARLIPDLRMRYALPAAAAACLLIVAGLMWQRPGEAPPAPASSAQVAPLQADQVEHALDDVQMLTDFSRAVRPDAGEL